MLAQEAAGGADAVVVVDASDPDVEVRARAVALFQFMLSFIVIVFCWVVCLVSVVFIKNTAVCSRCTAGNRGCTVRRCSSFASLFVCVPRCVGAARAPPFSIIAVNTCDIVAACACAGG